MGLYVNGAYRACNTSTSTAQENNIILLLAGFRYWCHLGSTCTKRSLYLDKRTRFSFVLFILLPQLHSSFSRGNNFKLKFIQPSETNRERTKMGIGESKAYL